MANSWYDLIGPKLSERELILHNRALDIAHNALISRQDFFKKISDPRRDIDDECGYPSWDTDVNPELYIKLYSRESIPNRVVNCLPKETWQVQPIVYEDEDPKVTTPFEEAVAALHRETRGYTSWHQNEKGSPIWEVLARADRLSGIGHYGVIFLGLDDGVDPKTPAKFREPGKKKEAVSKKLAYMSVFPEHLAPIARYNTDLRSPRYGHPEAYNISFWDSRDLKQDVNPMAQQQEVHWTRVVHIADCIDENTVFAVPRQRPVLNRLLDLRKLYGGSAEMYWKGAFFGLSFETNPALGGEVEVDKEGLRREYEEYINGLQRAFFLAGMSVKTLAPTVVDPTPQIMVQIQAICIQLGIPMRIFMGSERGQLASNQDDAKWNDILRDRQVGYVSPRMICPFFDRLISLEVLPEPDGYTVDWPDITSQTQMDKADVGMKRTQALAQYANSGLDKYMAFFDYLVYYQGFSEAEATAIEQSGIEYAEEVKKEELADKKAEIKAGVVPDPTKPTTPPSNGKPPVGKKKPLVAKPPRSKGRPPVRGTQ